jgi:hypothetical protein
MPYYRYTQDPVRIHESSIYLYHFHIHLLDPALNQIRLCRYEMNFPKAAILVI